MGLVGAIVLLLIMVMLYNLGKTLRHRFHRKKENKMVDAAI